jgi:hypothetical protein
MCELPTFVGRGLQLTRTQRTETAFGAPVVPLQVEFSTQRSCISRKRERPCELDINHVAFVQSLHSLFDLTGFPGTTILP